jgi:hypothetical protein
VLAEPPEPTTARREAAVPDPPLLLAGAIPPIRGVHESSGGPGLGRSVAGYTHMVETQARIAP